MTWVQRLYKRLTSAWSKDPLAVIAFTIGCDGTDLSWAVADGILTITPVGGTAAPYTVTLANVATIAGLAGRINSQQGYTITNFCGEPLSALSPQALADGAGDISVTNGGNLLIATSPQYLILQTAGGVLAQAEAQIPLLPLQMSTTTASGTWLDFLGGFFDVPRVYLEGDVAYAVRIIQQTIRPKTNNISMARALTAYTGLSAQVTDVENYGPGAIYLNGALNLDGSWILNTGGAAASGGLFDVEAGFDIIQGSELTNITAALIIYINSLKAAGTALRYLSIAPLSNLIDAAPTPNDATDTLSITYSGVLNGSFALDGTVLLSSGLTVTGTLSGS